MAFKMAGYSAFTKKKEYEPQTKSNKKDITPQTSKNYDAGVGTKRGQSTSTGIPEFLYTTSGNKISSENIDEGQLSTIKKNKMGRRYVVEEGTSKKYFLKPEYKPRTKA